MNTDRINKLWSLSHCYLADDLLIIAMKSYIENYKLSRFEIIVQIPFFLLLWPLIKLVYFINDNNNYRFLHIISSNFTVLYPFFLKCIYCYRNHSLDKYDTSRFSVQCLFYKIAILIASNICRENVNFFFVVYSRKNKFSL